MKKFSNTYIFIYSTILVVVVAVILTVVAVSLKPYQLKNQENENKQLVLGAIGIDNVALNEAADVYNKYITEEEFNGMKYFSFNKEGQEGYIVHFDGKGLQDSIFAYLAFDKQLNVIGAKFTHRAETPGLGAKMADPAFAEQFVGKTSIVDEQGNIVPIVVKKNSAKNLHEVDAISGGTRTSEGVNNMLVDGIGTKYVELFRHLIQGSEATAVEEVATDSIQEESLTEGGNE